MKTKYITEKRLSNPWITRAVIKSVKFKNNLYKDYKVGARSEEYYKKISKYIKHNHKNSQEKLLHEYIHKLKTTQVKYGTL